MSLSLNYPTVRPTLLLDFINTDQIDPRITFSRASSATYFNSNGILTTAATNALRRDYNPSTLAPQGFLCEEARTNLLTYSAEFNNAAWVKGLSSVTANSTTAPTNTAVADTLVEDTSTGAHEIYQSAAIAANSIHTFSVFLKANTRTRATIWLSNAATSSGANASANLSAGTIGSANIFGTATSASSSITNIGNGWYRCTISCVVDNSSTTARGYVILENAAGNADYTGDGTSGLFLWGAQLEAGAFATSYIPTTTTALTRSADVASVNTLSPWFNSTAGTLFTEWLISSVSGLRFIAGFDDGSDVNRIVLTSSATAGASRCPLVTVTTEQAGVVAPDAVANTVYKWAGVYANNDFIGASNGTLLTPDTSGTVPTVTLLRLGNRPSGASNLNGYLRRITYYPRRLSNAELQAITA